MEKDTGIDLVDENSSIDFEADEDDKKNYTDIYNALIRHPQITPEDFRVYVVIKSYTWGNGSWNLKTSDLIEQTGVKRTTLFACLKWLESNGFLKRVERRNENNERLPNKYIVKKLNSETGLPVGVTSIEKRKPAPKKKKDSDKDCGKSCGNPVDNNVDNLKIKQNPSSAAEPRVVQQANLGSSAGELSAVQQANTLNTIVNLNTIVVKDDIEKDNIISSFDSELSVEEVWKNIKEELAQNLTKISFNTWIKALKVKELDNGTLTIMAPNNFTRGIIENRYVDNIKETFIAKQSGVKYVKVIEVA